MGLFFYSNSYELRTLRWFRDNHEEQEHINHNYEIVATFVAYLDKRDDGHAEYKRIYDIAVCVCVAVIKTGNLKGTLKICMVKNLHKKRKMDYDDEHGPAYRWGIVYRKEIIMGHIKLSVYLSFLLRHQPESLGLNMDKHGYVEVGELISAINNRSRYSITKEILDEIVSTDSKGRYAYSADGQKIRACQGHSIPGVEPILKWEVPPDVLYHGTTAEAYSAILYSGGISKMRRHAVHLQEEEAKAWWSAKRWKKTPVVLKVDARAMAADGFRFGLSDNGVWCVEHVPVEYILQVLYDPSNST